jgi:hypothetical protein
MAAMPVFRQAEQRSFSFHWSIIMLSFEQLTAKHYHTKMPTGPKGRETSGGRHRGNEKRAPTEAAYSAAKAVSAANKAAKLNAAVPTQTFSNGFMTRSAQADLLHLLRTDGDRVQRLSLFITHFQRPFLVRAKLAVDVLEYLAGYNVASCQAASSSRSSSPRSSGLPRTPWVLKKYLGIG